MSPEELLLSDAVAAVEEDLLTAWDLGATSDWWWKMKEWEALTGLSFLSGTQLSGVRCRVMHRRRMVKEAPRA